VKNLNEKVKLEGKLISHTITIYKELKISLYHLFSIHGDVVDINIKQS